MIILHLEKRYWEKTRSKIRKIEKKNPHLNYNPLSRKLAKILDYSADILELMDQRFTSVSTLSGNREDATLRLEIDDDENSAYASFSEVAYFYKTNSVIRKKMDRIGEAFSYLVDLTPLDVGIPFHSTEEPMIQNGTNCRRFTLSLYGSR